MSRGAISPVIKNAPNRPLRRKAKTRPARFGRHGKRLGAPRGSGADGEGNATRFRRGGVGGPRCILDGRKLVWLYEEPV